MIVKIPWAYVTKKRDAIAIILACMSTAASFDNPTQLHTLMLRCNFTPNKSEHPPIEYPLQALPTGVTIPFLTIKVPSASLLLSIFPFLNFSYNLGIV